MASNLLSVNSIYLYLFGMWGKTGINCFLMITGYFMCTSHITLRKFIKLYLWVITYNVLLDCVFLASGYMEWSPKLLLGLFPMRNIVSDGFTSAFLVWWLFIPFLNAIVNNITRKQHLFLIGLTVLIFTVYSSVPKILNIQVNPICWFSTIYFIASYIRKYPEHIYKSASVGFWSLISIGLILTSLLSVVAILWLESRLGKQGYQYFLVSDSEKPLALLVAVSTFMWFKNIKLNYHKWINVFGGSAFGVLLIHANSDAMRQWLWKDSVDCVGHYALPLWQLFGYTLVVVLAIYLICVIIDRIRIRLIEDTFFKIWDKRYGK